MAKFLGNKNFTKTVKVKSKESIISFRLIWVFWEIRTTEIIGTVNATKFIDLMKEITKLMIIKSGKKWLIY